MCHAAPVSSPRQPRGPGHEREVRLQGRALPLPAGEQFAGLRWCGCVREEEEGGEHWERRRKENKAPGEKAGRFV